MLRPAASSRLGRSLRWGRRGTAAATIAARLTFEDLSHTYGNNPSVCEVSLDIAPGEVVCLLGPSGCGKTTLLRLAAGLEVPTAGRVLINGKEMSGPTAFVPPERRSVGLMFQDYALFPHLSILDNVAFGLTRLSGREARQEARLALSRVGLESYAEDYPHALSGGEQQRVALARAIAPRPSVLLMDEPFSGLDRRLRDSVRDETMAVLRETRATCIVVTHDPEEAMRMADRIALMRAGSLVQVGEPRDLYLAPADLMAARFFSELNEIPGIVGASAVSTPLGAFPAPEGLPMGAEVDVCVRPQGVLCGRPDEPGAAGRILKRRFLGEIDLLELAVEGLDAPLKARVRGAEWLKVGDDVSVTVAPSDVLIFAKTP